MIQGQEIDFAASMVLIQRVGPRPAEDWARVPLDKASYQGDQRLLRKYQTLSGVLLRASFTGIFVAGVLILGFDHALPARVFLHAGMALLVTGAVLALGQRFCCLRGFHFHLQALRAALTQGMQVQASGFSRQRTLYYRLAGYLLMALVIAFLAATALIGVVLVLCWQAR